MPGHKVFRPQHYTAAVPAAPYRLLSPPPQLPVGSDEFTRRLAAVGRAYRAAGVRAIVLVHGTFVGDDLLEWGSLLDRWWPRLGAAFHAAAKRITDRLLPDATNFSPDYAPLLEKSLRGADGGPAIPVQRFIWSGTNCHLARAIGAVRLIDELATLEPPCGDSQPAEAQAGAPGRMLLFGHSHGGNVLALAANLLAADVGERRRFLSIARSAVPRPRRPSPRYDAWQRACQRLDADTPGAELLAGRRLDIVTLGAPTRYGWAKAGYDRLLHIVNHRPAPRLPAYRTRPPGSLVELLSGRDGDYVHQLGIAGSDFPTPPWRWRRARAERRLADWLAPGLRWRGYLRRVRLGMRVADAGTTLLVDYGEAPLGERWRHVVGHGMYTHRSWMLFQAEQVAREWYGLQ